MLLSACHPPFWVAICISPNRYSFGRLKPFVPYSLCRCEGTPYKCVSSSLARESNPKCYTPYGTVASLFSKLNANLGIKIILLFLSYTILIITLPKFTLGNVVIPIDKESCLFHHNTDTVCKVHRYGLCIAYYHDRLTNDHNFHTESVPLDSYQKALIHSWYTFLLFYKLP